MKWNLFQPFRPNTAQTYSPFWTVTVLALLAMLILGVGGIYHTGNQLKALKAESVRKAKDIEQAQAFLPARTELELKQAEIQQIEERMRALRQSTTQPPAPAVRDVIEAIAGQAEFLQLNGFQQQLLGAPGAIRVVIRFNDNWADFTAFMDWLQQQGWCHFLNLAAVRQDTAGRHYEVVLEVPTA